MKESTNQDVGHLLLGPTEISLDEFSEQSRILLSEGDLEGLKQCVKSFVYCVSGEQKLKRETIFGFVLYENLSIEEIQLRWLDAVEQLERISIGTCVENPNLAYPNGQTDNIFCNHSPTAGAIDNGPLTDESQTEGEGCALVPKKHLETRFFNKNNFLHPNKDEVMRVENMNVITEIPDTFPFNYEMEMVLFGFFNILSSTGFNNHFIDIGHGYFPGSIGKKIFFIPLKRQRDLFDSIGMIERKPGVFSREEQVKQAFTDLMTYQHPVFHKRPTGETTQDGRAIFNCIVSPEPLFRLFKFSRMVDSDHIQPAILERHPNGGWKLRGNLRNSVVMLNPTFWPEGIVRKPRRIDSLLFRKIEDSIKRQCRREQKRYWRKDATYFRIFYYLLYAGGRFEENEETISSKSEHELWEVLKRLGLWEVYTKNEQYALTVLNRACRICKDLGYLLDFEWQTARKDSKKKLVMRRNLEKFPHIRQRRTH